MLRRYIVVLGIVFSVSYLAQTTDSEKIDPMQFLENIKQLIKARMSELKARKSKRKDKSEILKQKIKIRKKLIEKLSNPFLLFRKPEHYIINVKGQKSDVKSAGQKAKISEDDLTLNKSQNPQISQSMNRILKENPLLVLFKLPDLKQFFKTAKPQEPKANSEEKNKVAVDSIALTTEHMAALRRWYIDLSKNVLAFWLFFKKNFIDDAVAFEYLKYDVCSKEDMPPEDFYRFNRNGFLPEDSIYKHLHFIPKSDSSSYFNLFSPLMEGSTIEINMMLSKKVGGFECESFRQHQDIFKTGKETLCFDLQMLSAFGNCFYSSRSLIPVYQEIYNCLFSFYNRRNTIDRDCKNLQENIQLLVTFSREWFKYAEKIYRRKILPAYMKRLNLTMQNKNRQNKMTYKEFVYILQYELLIKPILTRFKSPSGIQEVPPYKNNEKVDKFTELIKKHLDNPLVSEQLRELVNLINEISLAFLSDAEIKNMSLERGIEHINNVFEEYNDKISKLLTLLKSSSLKTELAITNIVLLYKEMLEIHGSLLKFKNSKERNDIESVLDKFALVRELTTPVVLSLNYLRPLINESCDLSFISKDEDIQKFVKCIFAGKKLIEDCLNKYSDLLLPFFQLLTWYGSKDENRAKLYNDFANIGTDKSNAPTLLKSFCNSLMVNATCLEAVQALEFSTHLYTLCSKVTCDMGNFLGGLQYCREKCSYPRFIGRGSKTYTCSSPTTTCPTGSPDDQTCQKFCTQQFLTIPYAQKPTQGYDFFKSDEKTKYDIATIFNKCCQSKCYDATSELNFIDTICDIPSLHINNEFFNLENIKYYFAYILLDNDINLAMLQRPMIKVTSCTQQD